MSREQLSRVPEGNPEHTPEFLPQTDAIMRLYRGWAALEKPNGIDIVDFDLVPRVDPEPVQSRREVLDRLRSLCESINPTNRQEEFISFMDNDLRADLVLQNLKSRKVMKILGFT